MNNGPIDPGWIFWSNFALGLLCLRSAFAHYFIFLVYIEYIEPGIIMFSYFTMAAVSGSEAGNQLL
jgi:hypothetical protein